MKKEVAKKKPSGKHVEGYGEGEISLQKLVFYNVMFFVPIGVLIYVSGLIGAKVANYLETTP